jgi:DNA polymerase-3 subunit beta
VTDLLDSFVPSPKVEDGLVLEFIVAKSALEKAINQTLTVVSGSKEVTVLSNLHFSVFGNELTVTGSDGVLSVVKTLEVNAKAPGKAVFPANRLATLVKEAPAGDLNIKVGAKAQKFHALIKAGSTKWTIPLMSPQGFPDFTGFDEYGVVDVHREGFYNALSRVRKAVSTDTMRPYLMLVDVKNGRFQASDSIRYQQVKFDFPFDTNIPYRALNELLSRLNASDQEYVGVGQSDNALLFRFSPSVLFIAQKFYQTFPDVEEALLKPALANDQQLEVDRAALLKAIQRVRITADETTSAVVLSLNLNEVTVEARDKKGGVSTESVPASWNHPIRHVSFNHQHLTDLLSSTDSECKFWLGKDLKTRPTPLFMEDKETGFRAVLNQIRIDWL